ncbi:hypothetical protein F4677DRAFT_464569 [Hypoxylon crocopeplum]|nr:hypothetical protein F4677DRAFT_464569 [Hypoxylon crocopeplum]
MHLNSKIQQHKVSISLVLNNLQCESDIDARESLTALQQMTQKSLEENKGLRDRMGRLSHITHSAAQSVDVPTTTRLSSIMHAYIEEGDEKSERSTIRETPNRSHSGSDTMKTLGSPSRSPDRPTSSSTDDEIDSMTVMRPFENDLVQSLVYSRVRGDECDISFTTNQTKSALWSLLSSLSLSQVSNISVIALPVSVKDIWNSSWYKANLLATDPAEDNYKIAVLGYHKVGKTALIRRVHSDTFSDELQPAERHSVAFDTILDDIPCHLDIIDTSGVDSYHIIDSKTIEEVDDFVIAYLMVE